MRVHYLNELRTLEIIDVLERHPSFFQDRRVLEIGGGTGVQAVEIEKVAQELISIDIADSNLAEHANEKITIYDGHTIPYPDNYFDTVYSSNVLEHIAHRDSFQIEIMRVLKTDGVAIHSMPTQWWKLRDLMQNIILSPVRLVLNFYRRITKKRRPNLSVIELLLGQRHGEFGTTATEVYYFMPSTWKKVFVKNKWSLESDYPGEFFYTGLMFFKKHLSWQIRRNLAKIFGSSIHVFVLRKK